VLLLVYELYGNKLYFSENTAVSVKLGGTYNNSCASDW